MNLSGIAVSIRSGCFDDAVDEIGQLPGVEIHHRDVAGARIVVVQEAATIEAEVEGLKRIKSIPGVVVAELVYHYFAEDESALNQSPQEFDAASGISQAVLRPAVAEFLEYAALADLWHLEQATIREGSKLIDCELKNSGLRQGMDIIVLAVQRVDGEVLFNPTADTVLRLGDTLIAMGDQKSLGEFERRACDEVTR